MDSSMLIELVGYLGSALVLVSFLMVSVVRLRIVNTLGSLIFAVYALVIRSYPTALMNMCLVLINLYFLWKLRSRVPNYQLLDLSPQDSFLRFFLDSSREDLRRCFPGRDWESAQVDTACMVLHGMEPAGLLLAQREGDVLELVLDYTTPSYRDCSVGRFLLEHLPRRGLRLLRYARPEPGHVDYLEKLGFVPQDGVYQLSLDH